MDLFEILLFLMNKSDKRQIMNFQVFFYQN